MKKNSWGPRIVGTLGLTLLLACLAIVVVKANQQECYAAYDGTHNNCTVQNVTAATLGIIAQFVERHEAAIEAFGTLLIAGFTFTLWISTRNLWREAIDATNVARTTADAAKKSADIAKKTSEDNLMIATHQIEEARRARILQYRPTLRIRDIVVNEPSFPIGHRIAGRFSVSNIGGSRAHIGKCRCEVVWGIRGLPMDPPYIGKVENCFHGGLTIEAGAYETSYFCSDANFDGKGKVKIPDAPEWNGQGIYVMGWIEYTDDLPIKRRTAFCRQLENRDGVARFYPVDDPDYEYED